MEDSISPGLFETTSGFVHSLSGGGEGTDSQQFDLLRVSETGAGINDLLSRVVKVLRETAKLLHFSFDEGVTELLDGAVDDGLIRLARLEDPLAKRIEGGLGTIAGSCAKFDREYWVSAAHGKMSARADVVEYEVHVFGLALVIVRIVDGCRDAEPSIGSIFDERRPRMSVTRVVIDDGRVGAHYYDWRSGGPDALCQRRWCRNVVPR